MSTVVSLRLHDDQIERLRRAARQMGRRPSEAAALLLEESLRQREFAFIEFRDSPAGREAYLKGSRLQVWWIAHLILDLGEVPENVASRYDLPPAAVQAALAYAAAYPDEINEAIADNSRSFEELSRIIPGLKRITIDAADV